MGNETRPRRPVLSRWIRRGGAVLAVASLAPLAAGCGSSSSTTAAKSASGTGATGQGSSGAGKGGAPVVIGTTLPLTGPLAALGADYLPAMQAAVRYIDSRGGVLGGRKLQLKVIDTQSTPTQAAAAARSLGDAGVAAATTDFASADALAQAPVFNSSQIPAVTATTAPALSNPKLNPSIFAFNATAGLDSQQAVKYLAGQGVKSIGIISEDVAYGTDATNATQAVIKAAGTKAAGAQYFSATATDVSTQMQALKSAGAQGVITWAYGPGLTIVMRAEETMQWHPLTIGTILLGSTGAIRAAVPPATMKDAFGVDGPKSMLYANTPGRLSPQSLPYREFMPAGFSGDPMNAAYGFDAIMILSGAIDKAGSTDHQAIKQALESGTSFPGIRQNYSFSSTNHLSVDESALGPFGGDGSCTLKSGCKAAPGVLGAS
jgi:branched-chain amino acid transport system substrate-binding protein